MSVLRAYVCMGQRASCADYHYPTRPFSCASSRCPRHPRLAASSSSMSIEPAAAAARPGLLKQLLEGAVSLVSKPGSRSARELGKPCAVSYLETSPHFTPMSAAARMAFAALEQDNELEQQAALGALCLVTYSDEEDDSRSNSMQASSAVREFAALNALQMDELHSAVSVEDSELAAGVMETLCIVTYDDDDDDSTTGPQC